MAAGILQTKSRKVFDLLDEDGDGVVTHEDFRNSAGRLLQAFGRQPGSDSARTVQDRYEHVWQQLAAAADRDGDGRVTGEEFAAVFADMSGDTAAFDRMIMPALQAEFELVDTDGDGTVTRDELGRMLEALGVPPTELDSAMDSLDQDRDGRVSLHEYCDVWRDYYTSSTPSPAAGLLGRIRGA
ncbi:EF-hand domain-containing protein [Streptomyces sp. HB2AG]|uniref:EF-hand domain-containing protein n=1 Tax=Streptomyces sp. HB2AG TaxID=2983400 RepID=UPI0022AB331C|nr:EF-hand domain-containing protein [Streptomyces sp. HB2AG]MCZ2523482.1 EF-hand domain-containing protein [Streptomyces sp. HB2AG]